MTAVCRQYFPDLPPELEKVVLSFLTDRSTTSDDRYARLQQRALAKPYRCRFCPRRFLWVRTVRRHEQVHRRDNLNRS